MLRLGKLVLWLGALLMCFPFVAVPLAWFQLRNSLTRFDAQQELGRAFAVYLDSTMLTFALTLACGLICFLAGRYMHRRRRIGWWVWAFLCGGQLGLWLFEVVMREASWLLFFRGVLWLGLGLLTLLAFRAPSFDSWWTTENAP